MRPEAYQTFTRSEWAQLRANTPLTLTQGDLLSLRGLNENVSLEELADVYLPLSRLCSTCMSGLLAISTASPTRSSGGRSPGAPT
jgi:pantothenate kinase